ncbi:MAG: hypothetical protein KGH75_00255 [Rhodospirillales bacterium]|nr:hypothetical protein [Rhodospirillales bacterium]
MTAAKSTTTRSGFLRPSTLAGIPLGEHDDLPITQSNGTITGLAGGFSETAAMDKIHVPVGSRVIALVVMVADSHEYDRVTEGRGKDKTMLDEFVETTVYKGESVLLIDPDDVEDLVKKHQEKVAKVRAAAEAAAKAARGELPLPFGTDDEDDDGGEGEGDDA